MVPARTTVGGDKDRAAAPDPYAAYRFVGNAFALVIVAASLWEFWRNGVRPSDRDFLACWSAAQLALSGHSSFAYDNAALHAVQSAAATFGSAAAQLPFPYPPAYLLIVIPFGLMSFPVAMAAWSAATFAFYLFAARRLIPRSGWLAAAFPAVFANAAIGQNGFLTAGLFMAGLALLESSPFAAGLLLGCLVVKPQLALLLPVALLAARKWRAIGGGALSSIAIMLAGLAIFGPATTFAWLREAPLIVNVTGDGLMGWSKLASVYAAARQAGVPPSVSIVIHGIVALAAAALVWRVWSSRAAQELKVAILGAGSMLVSPYLFYYDCLFLVPAFFYLAREKLQPGILLVLWCVPLLLIAQIGLGDLVNLNPIVPIALVLLTFQSGRSEEADLTFRQPSHVRISQRV